MMSRAEPTPIPRRTFLRGATGVLALPLLESLVGARAIEAIRPRMVWVGFNFGVTRGWYPQDKKRKGFDPGPALKALESHLPDLSLVRDTYNPRGTNPHYGTTTFLTCADLYGTPGRAFHNTVSCDQIAAQHLGADTRYASLQLSSPSTCIQGSGGWGPGLSLAWNERGYPVPAITRPIDLFQRLFGDGKTTVAERRFELRRKKSMLDSLASELRRVEGTLTREDREKLQQYAESIRDIERQLAKDVDWVEHPFPEAKDSAPPVEIPSGSSAELNAFYDLMAIALEVGATRVITYRQACEGILKEIGYPSHSHGLNHGDGDPNLRFGTDRDRVRLLAFGRFLERLKSIREADGQTLLHHSVVSFGSEISTEHMMRDLPVLVAGQGGGTLRSGQQLRFQKSMRLSNLWLTLLRATGCPVDSFSNSTRELQDLLVRGQ